MVKVPLNRYNKDNKGGENMDYFNPYAALNPYIQVQAAQQQQARQEVVKVNGENGARAYQIGANSSALLLDESGLMIWLVTTDGAGYKTCAAYDIAPHKTAPQADYAALEERITRLEGVINGNTRNTSTARQECSQQLTIPDDE